MEGKYVLSVIVVLAVIVFGFLIYSSGPEVSAQGTASIDVQPDELSVYMDVLGRGKTAQEAKAEHDEMIFKLKSDLKYAGFKDSEIQTMNYNVYQEYDYSTRNAVPKGYVVSEQLVVKTKEFDRAGVIIDQAIGANVSVNSINFELSQEKQNEVKANALKEAGKDAENKAKSIAEGVGKKIGRLVSVNSQEFYYPGPVAYYEKALSAESSVAVDNSAALRAAESVNPGEIEITAQVNVKYKLSRF